MGVKSYIVTKFVQGKLPKWVYRFVGRKLGEKLGVNKMEDSMAEEMKGNKKWWLSKSVLNGIVIVLVGLYGLIQTNLAPQLPVIPEWIFTILGSIGIWTRVVADKKIS